MSNYPECHHGFNDPNGICNQCALEDKYAGLQERLNKAEAQCEIYRQETHRWSENTRKEKRAIGIYEDALRLILSAKGRGFDINYAEGVAHEALTFLAPHYMKASESDPDTCARCGLNFRAEIHFRVNPLERTTK